MFDAFLQEKVNSSCAQLPRASSRKFAFFFPYGRPMGRGTYVVKYPATGTKVEGKCLAPKTALNLWPRGKCTNVF